MSIESLRNEIDSIDSELLKLLEKRARIAQEIGKLKANEKKVAFDPAREIEILRRLTKENKGILMAQDVEAIFRQIIAACRNVEKRDRLVIPKPYETPTRSLAWTYFGPSAKVDTLPTVEECIYAVESGRAAQAIVPESIHDDGVSSSIFELIIGRTVFFSSVLILPQDLNIYIPVNRSSINRIYTTHIHAGRARSYLSREMPFKEVVIVESIGEAIKLAKTDPAGGLLAPQSSLEGEDWKEIASGIEETKGSQARYFVISFERIPPSPEAITTVAYSVKEKLGALHSTLTVFKKHSLNLVDIHSRPRGTTGYLFFVSFQGHVDEPSVQEALRDLEKMTTYLQILGSYILLGRNQY